VKSRGFTIIELAIVLLVLSVMALFMVPAIGRWLDNYRLKQAARGVVSDLQYAKIKAMSLGRLCTIAFTSTGYTIFDDANNNYLQDNPDEEPDGEKTLKRVAISDQYRHVVFDSTRSDPDGVDISGDVLAFTARGLPMLTGGAVGMGSIYLRHTRTNKCQRVRIVQAGRIRITEY